MVDTDDAADMRDKLVAELLAQEKIVSGAMEGRFAGCLVSSSCPQAPIWPWRTATTSRW